jgi:hypothetical protein
MFVDSDRMVQESGLLDIRRLHVFGAWLSRIDIDSDAFLSTSYGEIEFADIVVESDRVGRCCRFGRCCRGEEDKSSPKSKSFWESIFEKTILECFCHLWGSGDIRFIILDRGYMANIR